MTTDAATGQDEAKAQAFAQKMLGVLIGGRLTLMLSIGHETGLFDTMRALPPSTSCQIAEAAGLNERYVREWLGAVVTGGTVTYDPQAATYALPLEHARVLTRAGEIRNFAAESRGTVMLTQNYDAVATCFRDGGGVPYEHHERFTSQFAERNARVYDATLVQRMVPAIPGIVERLQAGIDVADIGCGRGHAINLMARAFPNSSFVGIDFLDEPLAFGRAEAADWGLPNASFEAGDAAQLAHDAAFDLITAFDAIHDQTDPARVLANIARALRPGGTFLMVDIAASSNLEENLDHLLAPSLYAASVFHCMTVSLAYGGAGLGNMWGEQLARQMLTEAGFSTVHVLRVDGDYLNNYFVATR